MAFIISVFIHSARKFPIKSAEQSARNAKNFFHPLALALADDLEQRAQKERQRRNTIFHEYE
jgi:hypothetical protein